MFWDSLDKAIGFDLGPARRQAIGQLLDHPYGAVRGWEPEPEQRRGPKVKWRPDVVIECLASIVANGELWPSLTMRHERMDEDELLMKFRSPSFARFLLTIRKELPADCQLTSPFEFLRVAEHVLRHERGQCGMPMPQGSITLRNASRVTLMGHKPGEIFSIPTWLNPKTAEIEPVATFWKNRLDEDRMLRADAPLLPILGEDQPIFRRRPRFP